MIQVTIEGEHYIIALPKMTLVMTMAEFISSLQRGKRWCRRKVQVERKAQASLAAEEKRGWRA
jgi:hypothetical protein